MFHLTVGSCLSCARRVMNALGRLISTLEAVEAQKATLAPRKLSNFPSESIIRQSALAMNH